MRRDMGKWKRDTAKETEQLKFNIVEQQFLFVNALDVYVSAIRPQQYQPIYPKEKKTSIYGSPRVVVVVAHQQFYYGFYNRAML